MGDNLQLKILRWEYNCKPAVLTLEFREPPSGPAGWLASSTLGFERRWPAPGCLAGAHLPFSHPLIASSSFRKSVGLTDSQGLSGPVHWK